MAGTGHSDRETMEGYAHISLEVKQDAAENSTRACRRIWKKGINKRTEEQKMYQYIDMVQQLLNEMFSFYKTDSKNQAFYEDRVLYFFNEFIHNSESEDRPLDSITFYEVNTFLSNFASNKVDVSNYYYALKKFFKFTYHANITTDIFKLVNKPLLYKIKEYEVMNDDEYDAIRRYILDESQELEERLILGLFLFTGLSRQYIVALRLSSFNIEDDKINMTIWKGENEVQLPIKSELQKILISYIEAIGKKEKDRKIVDYDENYLSTRIGR